MISSTRPGVLKPATSTFPSGSSCASDGYEVGVRIVQSSFPAALIRSTQPPISVTSTPPSASGVAPFGDERPCGGLWPQLPACPISRTTLCARLMKSTRQFWMSATMKSPFGSRYASSGLER